MFFIFTRPLLLLITWLIIVNLILFTLMGSDKKRAKQRAKRVPEKLLLTFGLAGGGLGGLLAMQLFRHKTKHRYFYFIFIVSIVLWIGIFSSLK